MKYLRKLAILFSVTMILTCLWVAPASAQNNGRGNHGRSIYSKMHWDNRNNSHRRYAWQSRRYMKRHSGWTHRHHMHHNNSGYIRRDRDNRNQ